MFKHDSYSKQSACDAGDPVLGGEDPLKEEMATCSNILAWGIAWTEEPGRLQSVGSPKSWIQLRD